MTVEPVNIDPLRLEAPIEGASLPPLDVDCLGVIHGLDHEELMQPLEFCPSCKKFYREDEPSPVQSSKNIIQGEQ